MNSDIIMHGFGRVAYDAYPLPVEGGPDDASIEAKRPMVCIRRVEPRALSAEELGMLHQERLDLLEQMFAQARLRARCAPPHEDMLPQEVGFEIAMSTYREWLSMARGKCGVP